MSVHYQFGFGYGTQTQIAAYTGITYEPVYDTTNNRMVVMLGGSPGNMVSMASEAYVQAQIGALTVGAFQNQYLFLNTIYP